MTTLALLAAAGCAAQAGDASPDSSLQFRGEIVHLNLEGGFWGIVAEDGRRYDPGRLPREFQRAGLKVRVTAKVTPARVSFRMWGTPIDIIQIERAEP